MSKRRKMTSSFGVLSKNYNFNFASGKEEPPVLNARIIEHSPEEVEKMERREKERKFWNKMIRGDGLGGKKGHDN